MSIVMAIAAGCSANTALHSVRARAIEGGVPAVQQAAAPVAVRTLQTDEVVFAALVAGGSAFDPVGKEGTAWRVAHALVRGGAGSLDAAAFGAAVSAAGAVWTIDVQRQWVSVRLTCPPLQASVCGERFADALTAPRFDPEVLSALSAEARVRLDERSDPDRLADEVFTCAAYEGHRYGHRVEGRTGVLDVISPADVAAFYRAHYVRQAVRVGTGAPVDGAIRDALAERLLALPSALPPDLALYAPPRITAGTRLVVDAPGAAARIGAPFRRGRNDPEWPALWLGAAVLQAELGGALPLPAGAAAREQEDLRITVDPAHVEQALAAARRWAADGVAADRFETTRAEVLARLSTTPAPLEDQLLGGPDLATALTELTAPDVNAAIARGAYGSALSVVAVGEVAVAGARHVAPADLFR